LPQGDPCGGAPEGTLFPGRREPQNFYLTDEMIRQTVLVAGATGALGRHVVRTLNDRGHHVRALGRRRAVLDTLPADETVQADLTDPATLGGLCQGVDAVISCAGASMKLDVFGDRRSFTAVDYLGNRNLLREAKRAGVGRFVYVSLHGADRLLRTEYARAHEQFVAELEASGLAFTVVRPTGYFSFFAEILRMAQKGRGLVLGSGMVRTNPVHEADVAEVCVEALQSNEREIAVGGPETYTRIEIVELAFAVAGSTAKLTRVPLPLMRVLSAPLRLINPRVHGLMHFGIEISAIDAVAPAVGTRRLRPYFEELAGSRNMEAESA
jgi:uncharacterized protein YbjT (DUF2867 family)